MSSKTILWTAGIALAVFVVASIAWSYAKRSRIGRKAQELATGAGREPTIQEAAA